MYRISVLLGWYLFLGFYGICKSVAEQAPVTFTFKEYQYKDSPKNLEEGEIDVRLNSFKGCFIQRSGRTRN
ncbi:hypothetical protein MSG28_013554 [Choristoneura fumiferana]|uniref:Uncharacterized protein n=1 Tax=Choristoneura fumiferana TaxID=7141 RepID=A0ACC0K7W9_CHOFU|nr:hypothetical protein MSG28_013554 [Choristoneura fumiferana]